MFDFSVEENGTYTFIKNENTKEFSRFVKSIDDDIKIKRKIFSTLKLFLFIIIIFQILSTISIWLLLK